MKCHYCKREFTADHYARVVENKTPLYGPWEGWRLSGQHLIAPGKAGRIMPARLLGILWQEQARSKVQKKAAENSSLQNNFLQRSGQVFLMRDRKPSEEPG